MNKYILFGSSIILFLFQSCNPHSKQEAEIKNQFIKDSLAAKNSNTKEHKKGDTVRSADEAWKESLAEMKKNQSKQENENSEPFEIISSTIKTDGDFKDYSELVIKNKSNKTITNVMTGIITNKKTDVYLKKEFQSLTVNHKILIKPGRKGTLKVDLYMSKILRVRYSDGSSWLLNDEPY